MLALETLLAYLPQDRRRAMAVGSELPRQTQGAALCADLSGFTPLTESLARKLGKRRGAEELTLHLNRFYEALIAPVEAYGGSVVGFSGDAITCWFEADDGRRAIAAAQAMQVAMQAFASLQLSTGETIALGVKIAVASGPARRLQVGDPAVQYWDTLAGAIMDRLAALGHLAKTGELLLDESTETGLHEMLQIGEWRASETGCRAAVLGSAKIPVEPSAQVSPFPTLGEEQVRPWLLPAVFARLRAGQGEFLTELRPAVALFLCFTGLDYDNDEGVGNKLDAVIRHVQGILVKYDGALLQLTIGDKGSYLYAAFGAPTAHEDDAARAVSAALELCALTDKVSSIHSVSIGLSKGVMRTGAYGSIACRTYGVLGDQVNLAARLMQHAAPGQVLASETVWQATPGFCWQELPSLEVKGKRTAVKPAILLGRQEPGVIEMPLSALPMVGRQAELALIEEKLALARRGQGQIVSITGEAGLGKSRLLAEALRRAEGLARYEGECQSYGTQSAYLVWHALWRAFFGINPSTSSGQVLISPQAEQIETLEKALSGINPDFPLRLPLLGAALNLSIPDNGLTGAMDAKARKTSRESLLVDCLRAGVGDRPLVLILEDAHWIDPLSRDLLELIGRAIKELPVLILLAYRPPLEAETAFLPGLASLEYATEVRLGELTRAETEQLVAARLAHFGLDGEIPPALAERLLARAQGNPFYTEELLNYLHDKGLDPRLDASWQQADLPDSLHSLILSRIDQLSERQQITIKTASVIGRFFRASWLYEYYLPLGGPAQVIADLVYLSRLEFTIQETPEPQLAYLFKHVITQEAAYESLAYATRASLHEQFARYLEKVAGEDVGPFLDLLVYHYERSENLPKKREYLRKAGEAAGKTFANEAALSYLGRALALAPEDDYAERFDILFVREDVYDTLGKLEAENQDVSDLAALAEALDDNERRARAAIGRIRYAFGTSNYPATIVAAQQTVELARLANSKEFEVRGYRMWGEALLSQGDYAEAHMRYQQALALAQAAGLTQWIANSLVGLGFLDILIANYHSAQTHLECALQLQRQAGNRIGETLALAYLGEGAYLLSDFARAQAYYEQVLHSWHSIGYKQNEGRTLGRLANLIIDQRGDYAKARLYAEQALRLAQESGDRLGEMAACSHFSFLELAQNHYPAARVWAEQALQMNQEVGYRSYDAVCLTSLGSIADELGEHETAVEYHTRSLSVAREMGERDGMGQALIALGMAFYHLGQHKTALENSQQALSIVQETKNKRFQSPAFTLQGHAFRELGDLERAADAYRQALALALGLPDFYAKPAQTGLARIALARGNLAEAQASLEEILHYLETASLSTQDEIFWIYLTCYRILQTSADSRARATLQVAYNLLQEIAARIDDETLRASFLQTVRIHHEIIQAWESQATL
ncbi:MAG: tetratricopeptide repeat protein [Anaerolineales bacterium]